MNDILKQRLAAGQMTQSEHPSADTLTAFAEQNLKAPQREAILEHLAACADCRQTVMLAASEIPVEQPGVGLVRKPVFQFPAAMRWASLAAALAVAVGVGVLLNEHESAPRPGQSVETVQPPPAAPSTQAVQETAKPESSKKTEEARNEVLQPSSANKPASLTEKKKQSPAASRDRINPVAESGADVVAASSVTPLVSTGRTSNYGESNQEAAKAFVPNRDSDQKLATAKAVRAAPAAPPPAAEAFYGQTSDKVIGAIGGVAKTQPAPASANQTADVLQGAVTDSSGAAVEGAEVTITNAATGVTRVVKSGPNGSYRVDSVAAGIYKVEVARPGFTTATAERVETLAGASTTQNFQLQIGSATEAVEVSAEAPVANAVKTDVSQNATTAERVQIPYSKSAPGAAVGGPLRRELSTSHAGIVSWAISDTGQLQRMVSDGATTAVQPAPGMTVRAVAAEGIEVWAAGTQADLSAKEWMQRSVLFHSSDAGKTWSRVDGPWQGTVSQLALSGKGNLVVTTPNGVWVTNDAGKTWVPAKTKD